jgi:1-acyl-sn-glycerol-3-phosphate acyltransferase
MSSTLAELSFKILGVYSTLWMRNRCRVLVEGAEHLRGSEKRKRAYIVINHSTSFDLVALMHVAKRRFSVVMDEGAFHFPIVRHLFRGAGFIPLVKSEPEAAVRKAVRQIRGGIPVVLSLTGGGSTLGKKERPRVGGVRIAHLAGATIYPVFTAVETNRKKFLSFKGLDGNTYRYTTFRNSLYYISILPAIPASSFGSNETYESYQRVAYHLKELADRGEARYEKVLRAEKARLNASRWRGGCRERIFL